MPVGRGLDVQPLPTTARLGTDARKLGANDLGIVEDQPVTRVQQLRQISDVVVVDRLPAPINDHQPSVRPLAEGFLCHQVPRKLVIKGDDTGRHGI